MKKLLLLLFGLFLTVGFIGCNSDGSEIKIDMDEFIASPTNLSFDGDTLLWSEVADAKGYTVYADGEEVDKVTEPEFDFSDLDGDVIVFQVKTRAPRGMQDSPLSVTIAHVENRQAEVAAVNLALSSGDMVFGSQGFAEELVNKGMTAEDVTSMMDGVDEYYETMDSENVTTEDMVSALRDLVEEFENVEAFVSAIVKTEFPIMLQIQINDAQAQITRYQGYSDPYWESEIAILEEQIDLLQSLVDEINDNPDRIVLAITATIEYFLSIEEMVNDNLIDLIVGLGDAENPEDLNVSELETIKNEIVSILRETMPTEEDMILVIDLFDVLAQMSGTDLTFDSEVENFKGRMAAQTMYSLELFINLLDAFDSNFFDDLEENLDDEDLTEPMLGAELLILLVEVVEKFYDDNENLMDTINELYTDEEKASMYTEYTSLVSDFELGDVSGVAVPEIDGFSFQDILNLQVVFEDSLGILLDKLVDTDGEVIRQVVINSSFDANYNDYPYTYTNTATGEIYDSTYEMRNAQDLQRFDLINEILILVEEVAQSLEEEDMNVLLKYVMFTTYTTLTAQLSMSIYSGESFNQDDLDDVFTVLFTAIDDADEDMLTILQKTLKYIVDENVMQGFKELTDDLNQSETDYQDNQYATLILVAEYYSDFMTSRNRGNINDILDVLFIALGEDDITSLTEMSDTEIAAMEETVADILDLLEEEFDDIKGLDYKNLSTADIQLIEDFIESLEELIEDTEIY